MNKYAGPTNRYTELSGGELDQMDKDYVGNESGLLAARLRFAENVLFPGSGKDNYKVGGKQTLLAFVDEMAGALLDTQQRTGTNVVGRLTSCAYVSIAGSTRPTTPASSSATTHARGSS